jgi:tripartite-type tricarboxylate transporter receptor subunit TctC
MKKIRFFNHFPQALRHRQPRSPQIAVIAMLIATSLAAALSFAQETYPLRPLRFVVGFTPGGTTDLVARFLGKVISDGLGQTVVVDNRPGASGKIAAELVAKAPPDGYTLMLTSGSYAVAPSIYRKLSYDIQRDFDHFTIIANSPFMLATYPGLPANNLQELISYARSNPGKVNFASAGVGSPSHLASEVLAQMAKLELTHVPYKGSALAMNDLMSGRVQFYFTSIPGAMPHMHAGRIRALAVTSAKRIAALPEVPTVLESGLKDYRAGSWYGMAFPHGVPAPIVSRVGGLVQKGLSTGGLETKLTEQGLEVRRNVSPQDAAAFVREEVAYWAEVIRRAGIRPL